jgi:succinate-semialdehyde dehydrogenase/glutarate-semialdehyde dehydrogenase
VASPYGLAAYVCSEDLERAWVFAEQVEVGAVGVNVNDTTDLQAPLGGGTAGLHGRSVAGGQAWSRFASAVHSGVQIESN